MSNGQILNLRYKTPPLSTPGGCAAVEPALNVSIEEEARLRARAVFAMNMARSLRRILELL